jgi:hypothetical protein
VFVRRTKSFSISEIDVARSRKMSQRYCVKHAPIPAVNEDLRSVASRKETEET